MDQNGSVAKQNTVSYTHLDVYKRQSGSCALQLFTNDLDGLSAVFLKSGLEVGWISCVLMTTACSTQ